MTYQRPDTGNTLSSRLMKKAGAFLATYNTAVGFVGISLLTLLVAFTLHWQSQHIARAKQQLLHAYQVTEAIHELQTSLKDADIGHRGYLITSDQKFLEPYERAVLPSAKDEASPISQLMTALITLTSDNPTQQTHLLSLRATVDQLLVYFSQNIRLHSQDNTLPTQETLTRGKALMDQMRSTIASMLKEEKRLIEARTATDQLITQHNKLLILAIITFFYTGMLGCIWLATRHMSRSKSMEAEIIASARELEDSRSFLKNILNHVPDPIFVKDTQHRWIEGNQAFWEIMGRPEHEVRGKNDYDFFSKKEADVFWKKDEEVFAGNSPNINEETLTDAAGALHIISTKKARFTGPDGDPVLVGIIRDITELTHMQQQLRESDEARLKSILDHSDMPVYIKDTEGHYICLNKSLIALLGLNSEEDAIGKTDRELFPGANGEQYRKNDLMVITTGKAMEFEENVMHPDGMHTYISVKFPLYDPQKNIYATCGISPDITDRKRSQAKLQQYTEALERSNKELDDFAYIASHDLKEPLRGIHNHARFLLEDNEDKLEEESAKRLHRLVYLSQRMEKLVNDLLYFSRLGRQDLAIQRTDLNEVIRDIENTLDVLIKESNSHISIPTPLPTLTLDQPRITEVFRNLITNAIKYNDKDKKTVEIGFIPHHITAQGRAASNVLYVKDNGPGIPAEFSEEVFRIFKRLQSAKSSASEGTGAGLTFVKKIIERHGGDIWLESEPGKGTVFYFTLEGKRHDLKQAA